jgi:hydroxymethylpyrimidine/phosphomethylpyrimidine kinase
MTNAITLPRTLTIAGSDSGGGAGVQADLKTFTALQTFGMSAITALTAQNTTGVRGIHPVPPEFVTQQIDAVAEDIGIDAAKTGMLADAPIIEAVAEAVRRHGIEQLVVDPVMVAKSGHALLQKEAVAALKATLLPRAYVLTPNLPEAAVLTGETVESVEDMREAARALAELGPRFVLVKGGHLEAGDAVDLLFDGRLFHELRAERIATENTHGTGCTYSAAIAAYLARGHEPLVAIQEAKAYLTEAIRRSLDLGAGHGPLFHGWPLAD